MLLYHGSNTDFEEIDLKNCAPSKDFGKGFYTTTIFDQARAMAVRKSRIYGGEPCVITYEAPNDILERKDLTTRVFPNTSKDWAIFVINDRDRTFADLASPECNTDNKYDVVFGPVANDTLTTLLTQYRRGFIDSDILLKEMEHTSPSDQYSFHSLKAVRLLKKIGTQWIK